MRLRRPPRHKKSGGRRLKLELLRLGCCSRSQRCLSWKLMETRLIRDWIHFQHLVRELAIGGSQAIQGKVNLVRKTEILSGHFGIPPVLIRRETYLRLGFLILNPILLG
uniref:Uncharacterized protein n=1 Tax=Cannabis sativa TaxID=3483 RepID=A0A803QYV0_CANSA